MKTNKQKPTKRAVSKKTRNLPKTIPTNTHQTKAKSKNPKEYYQCMNSCCKGKNITQVARECKNNALAINAKISAQKAQAVRQIKAGYKQLGKGLTEFIKTH